MEINVKGQCLHPEIGSFLDGLKQSNGDVTVNVKPYEFCGRLQDNRVEVTIIGKDLTLTNAVNCECYGLRLESLNARRSGPNAVVDLIFLLLDATSATPILSTPTSTITVEQYDAGHSTEGVTVIDFGGCTAEDMQVLSERLGTVGKLTADVEPMPQAKTEGIWLPLAERYTQPQLPDGFDYYTLLDGENGPMLGNIYEDRQHPPPVRD